MPVATAASYAAELSSALADAVAAGVQETGGAMEGEEGLTLRHARWPSGV